MLLSVLPGRTEKGAEYLLDMLQEEFSQVWLQTQSTRFGWQRQLLTKKEKDLMSSQFKHVRDERIFRNPTEHFASQELLKRLLLLKLTYNTFIFSRESSKKAAFWTQQRYTILYTLIRSDIAAFLALFYWSRDLLAKYYISSVYYKV